MTPEQKQQRISEIRERRAKEYGHSFTGTRGTDAMMSDIDFLLSLVKSQEAETLQLRKEAASEVWDSERAIHKTKCPDCPHSIGLHALDSRIVGCTAGDGSEEDPICGCRTLYGEGIATSMRSCCVEKVKSLPVPSGGSDYDDAYSNGYHTALKDVVYKLESLTIQEQEANSEQR